MNTIPHGKIGGLPMEVREELNRRLFAGAEGPELLAWLNALPEVRALLESKFEGRPILQQNLSKWRQGAFQMWVLRREAAALFRSDRAASEGQPAAGVKAEDDEDSGPASLQAKEQMDMMAYLLAVRFSREFPQVDEAEGLDRLRLLERMMRLLTMLRRENNASIRIDLMRQQGGGVARPARSPVSAGAGRGQSSRGGVGAAADRSTTTTREKNPAQERSPAQVGSGTCTPPPASRPGGCGSPGMTVLEGPIYGRLPSEKGAVLEPEEEDEDFERLMDRLVDGWAAHGPIGADGLMGPGELARGTTPSDQAALLAAFPGWDLTKIFGRIAEVLFGDESGQAPEGDSEPVSRAKR